MAGRPGDGRDAAGADAEAAHASTVDALDADDGGEAGDGADDDLRRLLAAMDGLEQPHLLPGTQVGDYVVAGRIGAGGMGVVYRARDRRLERDVALKLHARVDTDAGRTRALREATAMARLSHPNVVTVFGVGSHGDHLYIAMEFVAGEDARQWQARGGRTWRELLELYLDAARGLAAAHRAGIVHRDFKPENVLVGRDGRVRVADFGLARKDGDRAAVGPRLAAGSDSGIAGTPGYMAPEQLAWQAGPAADQFAFGVALAEALHGRR
ncbi:MAG TPA: serine/threonine-protein kinase, partial [Kofleriaceae bacterium]|nr:serine/threonine-protein kinase [Kofleriaceae bacterium]